MANPESIDPVYSDMQKQLERAIKDQELTQRDSNKAKADYDSAPLRSRQRANAEFVYFKSLREVERATQMVFYRQLQLKSRKRKDYADYMVAFEASKDWPDPQEAHEYFLNQKLQNAPREWRPQIATKATPLPKKHEAAE